MDLRRSLPFAPLFWLGLRINLLEKYRIEDTSDHSVYIVDLSTIICSTMQTENSGFSLENWGRLR